MYYNNFTEKLLDLQGVIVKEIEKDCENNIIHIETVKKEEKCPHCHSKTSKVHDYRYQKIKDVPSFGKNTILMLRKRRYVCPSCNKRFYPQLDFLPRYYRITRRVIGSILLELKSEVSYTSVAKAHNVSINTVCRIFDALQYPKLGALPNVVAIDEFKGNAGGEKYLGILTDPVSKTVLDILPKRQFNALFSYFKPLNRTDVDFFICDMWKPYRSIKETLFPDSKLITDKFHFIRQVIWDFEKVRKEEQKKLSKTYRVTFKRSKYLLNKSFNTLKPEQQQAVRNIFRISPTLEQAHDLKEDFLHILTVKDFNEQKALLSDWIYTAQCYDIPEFKSSIKAISNWFESICNALKYNYTNGFTEGCNNKIKVLKRNAYGYQNFNRFRNRILHIFNY